jgi:hypothetical protein
MDIIKRNFFRLLRSGALQNNETLERMSAYKWNKLFLMVKSQDVLSIVMNGVTNHANDIMMNIPQYLLDVLNEENSNGQNNHEIASQMSNYFLNKRYKKIREKEIHSIDTSVETLEILKIIVMNEAYILNCGISLRLILELGSYLRTKGDKVDFVKLDLWLMRLHIKRMAQFEGSILISVFNFEKDEIPFVQKIEPAAERFVRRSIIHPIIDTSKEWHFHQGKSGFLKNNSTVLHRNISRSLRYIGYAPIETTSNFIRNMAHSLSEIEE